MANHLRKRAGKLEVANSIGAILGGCEFVGNLTVAEALVAADLNWGVGLRNVCSADKMRTRIPGWKCVHRTDNDAPLGCVKSKYTPISNQECFGWLDEVLKQNKNARLAAGGMLRGGQRVWMAVDLGGFEAVKGDTLHQLLVVTNANDASTHWMVHLLPVRMVSGTVANLHYNGGFYTIRHTKSSGVKLQEIAAILAAAQEQFKKFRKDCEAMGKTALTDEEMESYIFQVLGVTPAKRKAWYGGKTPIQPHWVKQYEAIHELLVNGPGASLAPKTLWSVFAACLTYFDHVRTVRGADKDPDNKSESRMTGYSAKLKHEAYTFALRLIAARTKKAS